MAKKRYSAEQIIQLLREVEIHTSEGKTVARAARQIGVTEQTYYRWRKEYGGLNTGQAKRLKALEKENSRLKRLVADLSLDNAVLKEILPRETYKPCQEAQGNGTSSQEASALGEESLFSAFTASDHPKVCPPAECLQRKTDSTNH